MPANDSDAPLVGLVLGSGGLLGGAFHAGVVKALLDGRGIDARRAKIIVGTSAGALSGALLAAGLHPNDLYRRETGQKLSPVGQRLFGAARSNLGPAPIQRTALGLPAAPGMVLRALMDPRQVALGSAAAGLLPRGKLSTDRIRDLIDTMTQDHANHGWGWDEPPHLKVCAVNMSTGHRTVFDGRTGASLGSAVAASCSVPGVFKPVTIGDTEYLDGGAHSSDNVDVIAGQALDLLVISSPMSTDRTYDARSPWHPLRVATRLRTDADIARLKEVDEIVLLRPSRDDLDAMGSNMLDPGRRAAVALQAYNTAIQRLTQ